MNKRQRKKAKKKLETPLMHWENAPEFIPTSFAIPTDE